MSFEWCADEDQRHIEKRKHDWHESRMLLTLMRLGL